MARKETFGTTGTCLRVRVFAGFGFEASDLYRSDFAEHGYDHGVPMGGDLNASEKSPKLLVRALRDPDGANLDRVQIIKGWLDASGKTHERVYDVAVSDGRTIGAGVDVAMKKPATRWMWRKPSMQTRSVPRFCTPSGKILILIQKEKAFYYARVMEIPTPRWTTYDAKFFGVERPMDVPASIQERAFTSPIWYNP